MLKKIIFPVLVFAGWRLYILIFQIFAQTHFLITSSSETLTQRLFTSWVTYWDGAHYFGIATNGYHFPQQAFFPLWPILIKVGTFFNLSGEISSYIFTFLLGISNFILFYLLAKKLIGEEKARWALVFFTFFPASIFLHAGYSENIFLFSTLLSFLLLENKKFFLSAIFAGFASASRIAGAALVASFLLIKTSFKNKIIMMIIGSLGLISYMVFLYLNYGDFLFFIKAQLEWCGNAGRCGFVSPISPLLDYGKIILEGKEKISLFSFRFNDWLSSMFFLSMLPLVWKKLPKHYFIYSLVMLLMPLSSGTTTSMIRVTLTVFPVFFVMPYFIKNNFIKIILISTFFLLALRFITLFSSYHWVA